MNARTRYETGFELSETIVSTPQRGAGGGEAVETVDTGATKITSNLPRTIVIAGALVIGGYVLWRWMQ